MQAPRGLIEREENHASVEAFGRVGIGREHLLSCPALAQETTDEGTIAPQEAQTLFPKPGYSPYAGNTFPTRPLFGDTHLHTSQSFDAISFGNFLGPEEAYQFARGEEVMSSTGQRARLSRPLDFLVVADHAENMGTMGEIKAGNPLLMARPRTEAMEPDAGRRR